MDSDSCALKYIEIIPLDSNNKPTEDLVPFQMKVFFTVFELQYWFHILTTCIIILLWVVLICIKSVLGHVMKLLDVTVSSAMWNKQVTQPG